MSIQKKMTGEIKAVGLATLYFAVWIGVLAVLKELILAEYRIEFRGLSMALVGALILAKVVLVLEHVSLGSWVRKQPAWVDVLLRTVLYSVGVAVVLALEKGFEARHEYGSFVEALQQLFLQADVYHVWANTIALSGALIGYNALSVVRRRLGEGGLIRMFASPLPETIQE